MVLGQIITHLRSDLDILVQAVKDAYNTATDQENVAENKYDTHGLEASYLVQGQARRAEELENALGMYQNLKLRQFSAGSYVLLSALVLLAGEGVERWLFVGPGAGGMEVDCGAGVVTIVTPVSPLGQALLGKRVGDLVEVDINGSVSKSTVLRIN